MHSNRQPSFSKRCVCVCARERRLRPAAVTVNNDWITVFEVAINNRAPGQKDEAKICSDRLAQVDGWQCEGINESTGPPTHGDESSVDGLMSSLYGCECRCVFVWLCAKRWQIALVGWLNIIFCSNYGKKFEEKLSFNIKNYTNVGQLRIMTFYSCTR